MPNDKIAVRFLNGRSIEACVRWRLGGACGAQFTTVFEANDTLVRANSTTSMVVDPLYFLVSLMAASQPVQS